MKITTVQSMFLLGMMGCGAFSVTITKDPNHVPSSIMIEDFSSPIGSLDRLVGLDFVSITNGAGEWHYPEGGGTGEGIVSFYSATTFDPSVYQRIRTRMYVVRNESNGIVDIFPHPVQGDGRIRFDSYPEGAVFRELSWDLGSVSPTIPFNGAGVRIDPFNYTNSSTTDILKVDYIIADAGGDSRGAEFDIYDDLDRYLLRNIVSASISDSIFSGTSSGTDSQIHLHTGIGVWAHIYKYVEFRVKVTAGEIKWFWKTDLNNTTGVVLATAAENDGKWHTYLCDMTDEAAWTNALTYNRFDPTNLDGVSFEVDYVRFMSTLPPVPPDVGYSAWASE